MQAHGTLYMSRTPPLATTAADGQFQLTLLLMDRMGPHRVEPWRVTWSGPEARAWWQAHEQALPPGQPLAIRATAIRSFVSGRTAPETHARVLSCALVPRPERADQTTDHQPQAEAA